jgi:hypothetical protein
MAMRSSLSLVSLLAWCVVAAEINVIVNEGPSKTPETQCQQHEAVEMGDIVALHFNASYHETSPSGIPGQFITSSAEHSEDGGPLLLFFDDASKDAWDSALLGHCEGDQLTLTVPPEYVHGDIFEGKNVPADAILKVDVRIEDILLEDEVDKKEEDEEFNSRDFDSDEDEEEEL